MSKRRSPYVVYYKDLMWIKAGVINHDIMRSLVYEAMGDRNISNFSKDCGVNPSTISRIINGICEPSFDTLCSICENACDEFEVTFEDLLLASGYGLVGDLDKLQESTSTLLRCIDTVKKNNNASSIKNNSKKFKSDCEYMMINYMVDKGYGIKKSDFRIYEYPFDFMIDIQDDDIFATWCFKFMDNGPQVILDALDELLDACYHNSFYDRKIAISLVINNKMCYNVIRKKYSDTKIHDYVSVILVHQTAMQVVDEFTLNQKK